MVANAHHRGGHLRRKPFSDAQSLRHSARSVDFRWHPEGSIESALALLTEHGIEVIGEQDDRSWARPTVLSFRDPTRRCGVLGTGGFDVSSKGFASRDSGSPQFSG